MEDGCGDVHRAEGGLEDQEGLRSTDLTNLAHGRF